MNGAAGRRRGLLAAAGLLAVALSLCLAFYRHHPVLYDADAYYHLAIARTYAREGFVRQLPQLRASLLGSHFGDKELLFHTLLEPFAAAPDPMAGGRLALALLDGLLLAGLGLLAYRAVGLPGLLLPFWLVYASPELSWRLVRLRPELLSLGLLLAATWAAARERYRLLGVLAVVYTLSYTAFQAFLGLVLVWFLFFGQVRRRWSWRLLLYPVLGVGVGLLVHPAFPDNLRIWAVQNVGFFFHKGTLDVGTEIRPNTTDVVLMANLGLWLGLLAAWRSRRRLRPPTEADARLADAFGLAAAAFAGLYLLMSRFSTYAVPFLTLWVLFEIRRSGCGLGWWTRLPGRGRIPSLAALAVCLAVSFPVAVRQLDLFARRSDPGPREVRLTDRRDLGRAMPAGARVAAPWRVTGTYLLWAPQGRYLNVLDPLFMDAPHPDLYELQQAIFTGREPDVPLASTVGLDSDYLAYATPGSSSTLGRRLASDPRVVYLHRGIHVLVHFVPPPPATFVLDWRWRPAPAAGQGEDERPWAPYPRRAGAVGRELEGYVDARRVEKRGRGCLLFEHTERTEASAERVYELAPYGPATLRLDGAEVVKLGEGRRAVLGGGALVPLRLAPGRHRFTVLSCPDPATGRNGFYLARRQSVGSAASVSR